MIERPTTPRVARRAIMAAVITSGLLLPAVAVGWFAHPGLGAGYLRLAALGILVVLVGQTAAVIWLGRRRHWVLPTEDDWAPLNPVESLPQASARPPRVRPCPCCAGNKHGWVAV